MIVAREVLPPIFLGTRRYVCATVTCYLLRKSAARLRPVVASVTPGLTRPPDDEVARPAHP